MRRAHDDGLEGAKEEDRAARRHHEKRPQAGAATVRFTAEISIAIADAAGVPLGVAVDYRPGVAAGAVERFSFAAAEIDHVTTGVYSVVCI